MKKSILVSIFATISLMATTTPSAVQSELEDFNNSSFGKLLHTNPDAKVYKISKHHINNGEWLQVRTNMGDFFLSSDYKYLTINNGMAEYDEQNNYFKKVFIKDNYEYIKKDAAFSKGEGKKEIIIFSNPECGACKSLDSEISANFPNLYKEYKFYYVLTSFPGSQKGETMLRTVFKEKDEKKRRIIYEDFLNDKNLEKYSSVKFTSDELKKTDDLIKKHKDTFLQIGTTGTPTFYSFDGEELNITKILNQLKMEGVSNEKAN